MDPNGIIKQLNDLVNENIKLKKENEELKANSAKPSNDDKELLKEIDTLKAQLKQYEEQMKTLDIDKIKEQLTNYNSLVKILKFKLIFIKNEYNKLSDCANLLYTYYKTAKLLNPNLLEISKQINQDKIIPYIIKYNIPSTLELDENGELINDTTGDPIGELTYNLEKYKDIELKQLTEGTVITSYESKFFGTKKEENLDDDIEVKKNEPKKEHVNSENKELEKND